MPEAYEPEWFERHWDKVVESIDTVHDSQAARAARHARGEQTAEFDRRWAESLRVRGAIDSVLGNILSRHCDPQSWVEPREPEE